MATLREMWVALTSGDPFVDATAAGPALTRFVDVLGFGDVVAAWPKITMAFHMAKMMQGYGIPTDLDELLAGSNLVPPLEDDNDDLT